MLYNSADNFLTEDKEQIHETNIQSNVKSKQFQSYGSVV
jgi:hypothetical protein